MKAYNKRFFPGTRIGGQRRVVIRCVGGRVRYVGRRGTVNGWMEQMRFYSILASL